MLVSAAPNGALILDHWGAIGGAADGEAYLPQSPTNRPSHRHFLDGVPQAFTVYGEPAFKEPCLCAVYADGTRSVRLAFQADRLGDAASIDGPSLPSPTRGGVDGSPLPSPCRRVPAAAGAVGGEVRPPT